MTFARCSPRARGPCAGGAERRGAMLRVRSNITLSPGAAGELAALQSKVDGEPDYPSRVAAAKRRWESTRKGESPFAEVKTALDAMCWGHRRCVYCEDSLADEIEHFWPKDLYPDRVFAWENYLYACGPCNGPKGNAFAILPPGSVAAVEVARKKGDAVVPPIAGDPALLDPRRDDPLDYLELDLMETFRFRERPGIPPRARERARYTIVTLGLNDRSSVIEARRTAYEGLLAVLERVVSLVREGRSLDRARRVVENTSHRSVWEEMKRQHERLPELTLPFSVAPVALRW
jgi:uncharacterized protein (TIGR02646 family)